MYRLPSAFDKNEWFILLTTLLLIVCFIAIPRIIPRGMTVSVFLLFAVLGLTADTLIGADYPANFYTVMDSPKLELFDVLIYVLDFSLYGYFFSYAIYKWRWGKGLLLFVPLWCGITVLLEFLSVKCNVFTYENGWNLGLSAISYLFVFAFSAIAIKLFARLWSPCRSLR